MSHRPGGDTDLATGTSHVSPLRGMIQTVLLLLLRNYLIIKPFSFYQGFCGHAAKHHYPSFCPKEHVLSAVQ